MAGGPSPIKPRGRLRGMIPKIIHQIWLGGTDGLPEPPPHLAEASRSWVTRHPDWEYRTWSGEDIVALFQRARPDLLELYRRYPYFVNRADAARYLILHEHGGVYADFDVACAAPLDGLLDQNLVLAPTKPFGVSNDLMMARPGHPLFRAALDGLPARFRYLFHPWVLPYARVMLGTGSVYLSQLHRAARGGDSDVRYLTADEYGHGDPTLALVRHLRGNSWHSWDSRLLGAMWTHWRVLAAGLAAALAWAWLT